jgi:amidase
MDRRRFLRNGSIAIIAPLAIASCQQSPPNSSTATTATPANGHTGAGFELSESTIDDLQQKMTSGSHTARSIAEAYLKRIAELDQSGPKINSVIELNPDALSIADAMDKERKDGKLRGPMHGIPVLIKDNINTGDKMMTTAGALALKGNIATADAFIIRQLRASGAVILGKTNLSEWANFRSTRSTSGWSSRGGQTRNPVAINRNPCGSSSGSGAAVAANFCAVAIGTETDGSIIAPASFCGIVGIKPTVGLLSRSGIIPISATQDTAGPMARTVKDAALLLNVLTGIDEADPVTKTSDNHIQPDYTTFLDTNAFKGKRIGIEKQYLSGQPDVIALYKENIELLKTLGATIVEVELLEKCSDAGRFELAVLQYEFKDGVNKYLASSNSPVKTLKDVIEWNKQHEKEAMPFFKQETLEACEKKGLIESAEYKEAVSKTTTCRSIIDNLMKEHRLDAIASTSIGPANLIDLVNGDYDTGFYFCPPAAMAGYPHITVPMGTVHELPIGLSFIAGAWQEPVVFALGYAFEQASKQRKEPQFLSSLV